MSLSNLSIQHAQLDEIWTFCRKKQRKLKGQELNDPTIGDQFFYTALDMETKLLFSYALGKRTSAVTDAFVADVESRMIRPPEGTAESQKPQISTDGFNCYAPAIDKAFGNTAKHGMIIKSYTDPESGRYAPPALRKPHTFVTYITSLGDDELEVLKPIPVTVRQEDDEDFIASFFDANIGIGGETPQSAISNLQSLIADCFLDHEDASPENLGPLMIHQRTVLLDVICRISQKSMQKTQSKNSTKKLATV